MMHLTSEGAPLHSSTKTTTGWLVGGAGHATSKINTPGEVYAQIPVFFLSCEGFRPWLYQEHASYSMEAPVPKKQGPTAIVSCTEVHVSDLGGNAGYTFPLRVVDLFKVALMHVEIKLKNS